MPSPWKRISFSAASTLCVGSVALLLTALSTERWVSGRILCQTGVDIVNASSPEMELFTGSVHYGLFAGGKTKKCGLGTRRSKIHIFPNLVRSLNGGLHMMVILFLLAAVFFALVSLSFSIYNARKVPYQSIKGHKGLYLWNIIAAAFGGLAALCFLAAVRRHSLTERVVNYGENLFALAVLDDALDWSFWLSVASAATHLLVCGAVAVSRVKMPKTEVKMPQEPTISALDLLY
ncbi:clarin-2 [Corythoichthys intestinalis]|uniref:clarin-2 n=1 Tax=Corythoichthys intestinalis TaxID=161448 RepID=UPI0025A68135|nr:clarin-2 [Corythoichthys intestinalis]XP_061791552.1 clarin-2-like [Nerophis lumbriciformis]